MFALLFEVYKLLHLGEVQLAQLEAWPFLPIHLSLY